MPGGRRTAAPLTETAAVVEDAVAAPSMASRPGSAVCIPSGTVLAAALAETVAAMVIEAGAHWWVPFRPSRMPGSWRPVVVVDAMVDAMAARTDVAMEGSMVIGVVRGGLLIGFLVVMDESLI